MMKKLTAILLLAVLLLAGCAKTTTEPKAAEIKDPCADYRAMLQEKAAPCAVIHLGSSQKPFSELMAELKNAGLTEAYPFLQAVTEETFVQAPGAELYAILPARTDATVVITELEIDFDTYTYNTVQTLCTVTDGKPVLLRCNISDICYNTKVTLEAEGKTVLEFSPYISLRDGSVETTEGVHAEVSSPMLAWDGSLYLPQVHSGFVGAWYAEESSPNGETAAMILSLEDNGMAYYCYGPPYSEILESFGGSWEVVDNMLYLELENDLPDAPDDILSISSDFSWYMENGNLILTHTGGDPLLSGTENSTFCFTPQSN